MAKRKSVPDGKCGAKTRSGGTCKKAALKGATRCANHGGKSPISLKKAKERLAEQAIMRELEKAKLTGVTDHATTDPLGELQKLTTELIHMKNQLTIRVNSLGEKIKTYGAEGAEQAAVEIDLYLKVIDRLTKLLDIALKHDIEGKKVALEQAKADMVAGLIIRVLIRAGLTGENLEQAKKYVLEEISQLQK